VVLSASSYRFYFLIEYLEDLEWEFLATTSAGIFQARRYNILFLVGCLI